MSINCQLLFSAKEPCAWQLDPVQGRVVRLSLRLSSLIKKTRIVVEVSVKVDLYPEISLFCPSPDPSNQTTCSGNKFIKAFAPPYPWRWFHSFSSAGYVVTREFGYLNVVRVSDLIQCCFRYLGNSPCILGGGFISKRSSFLQRTCSSRGFCLCIVVNMTGEWWHTGDVKSVTAITKT